MKIINQYYILDNEYNALWFKKYVGKTLDELDFYKIVGHSIIQYRLLQYKIKEAYKDE